MTLSPENKAHIDSLTHQALLSKIRFAPAGDPWMEGETGQYWIKRREELEAQDPAGAVSDSKGLG